MSLPLFSKIKKHSKNLYLKKFSIYSLEVPIENIIDKEIGNINKYLLLVISSSTKGGRMNRENE